MYLVTGATGTVGRHLVPLLLAEGAKVRAVTRDTARAAAVLPSETEIVEGDPSRPDTLGEALAGVTGILLNPGAVGTAAAELLALAKERGAGRVVALSALNADAPEEQQPSRLGGVLNRETEAAAVASGLPWAALRSGCYAKNTAAQWGSQIRSGDTVYSPYAASNWAPLHERDIAEVAVRALLSDDLLGTRPVLTGPAALHQDEMIAAIGAALGRTLTYVEVPPEAAVAGMAKAGIPERLARGFLGMQAVSYLQEGLVTGEVERVLGRPGTPYARWAAENTALFTTAD